MDPQADGSKTYAYTTLITRANYLAGVIVLAQTLRKHGSHYPLIVLYTPSLKSEAERALELEAPRLNLILHKCELLLPPSHVQTWLIAERFTDTWTKLRVFEVFGYDTVCYLDADMAIFNRNMDCIFERGADLPQDWIAANHACVCNKEHDAWAPAEWNEENCAYTPLSHPSALRDSTPVLPESRPTHHLLNSGMFLYHPSPALWSAMLEFFTTTPLLPTFKFPDQDFLAEFFRLRWRSLGWQFNALKTMRYWHGNIWRDEEVLCLHYIVDKPWAERLRHDGTAGYKGNDGVTHQWWWQEYEGWVRQTRDEAGGGSEAVDLVGRFIARPRGEQGEHEVDPDMKAIGAKAQAFAENKAPEEETGAVHDGNDEIESPEQQHLNPSGQVMATQLHGEGDPGPVKRVRPQGSSQMTL